MEKAKLKERWRSKKPPLRVTGPLAMPTKVLPWEYDLLAVVLEAVEDSEQGEQEPTPKVTS